MMVYLSFENDSHLMSGEEFQMTLLSLDVLVIINHHQYHIGHSHKVSRVIIGSRIDFYKQGLI